MAVKKKTVNGNNNETQRKRAYGQRALRSTYSKRGPGLNVRTWVGKKDVLIRDDRGLEIDIPEDEVDDLIHALMDIKRKKVQREAG